MGGLRSSNGRRREKKEATDLPGVEPKASLVKRNFSTSLEVVDHTSKEERLPVIAKEGGELSFIN